MTNKNISKGLQNDKNVPTFRAFCFTDVHNNFAMLDPPYVVRKNVPATIDNLLRDYGKMDAVFVGGDLVSDYPLWNESGCWPYKFYKEYKKELVDTFKVLAKGEKVFYVAGNHDYAQGEKYDPDYNELVNGGKAGPGLNGAYNCMDFYDEGPMKETLGVLPEDDKFEKICEHDGQKYLLAYYYDLNGIACFGLSPDHDIIWAKQGHGFDSKCLEWLKNKLDKVDPNGDKVIFVNCHYVINQRYAKDNNGFPKNGTFIKDGADMGYINTQGGDAPELADVFKGHKNLFHLFGHSESWINGYTSSALFHYDMNGKLVDFDTLKRDTPEGVIDYDHRGFNSVYMGHFRPGWAGFFPHWFKDDYVYGYSGYKKRWAQASTGTPIVAQGMLIEVYNDRIVFELKNCGTLEGWTYEDKNVPYTIYLKK